MFRYICFVVLSFYFYKFAIFQTFANVFSKYGFILWEPSWVVAGLLGLVFYWITGD